jgi:ATP-dependent DNA helicase RecG
MKTASELLVELNELDEHTKIEAKTARETGKSILQTICAFANEPDLGGGYLLLGVAPAGNTFWDSYEVVGVGDSDKLQSDIASQCATSFNVPIRPRFAIEKIDNKTVMALYVAEAGSHEKPIHFKNQPLPESAYRRIGSTDQRCTEDDLAVFYQDRQTETYDEQIVQNAELNDIDPDAIALYRQLRQGVNPDAEELVWSDDDLLVALGCAKKLQNRLVPTVAGILLFGTAKALRQFFPMMRIDYIRVPGEKWVKDPDRRFDTVEIRSPLIRAVQRARATILDDLPKAFSLPAGELQGQQIPLLPDKVIREVVANAVMHRSYKVHGSIQIIRYSNRLEVRNPGYSLKAEERLGDPGSETRNPKIAAVLHDINYAETKGSGIRVMRQQMKERDLPPPLFQSDRIGNCFVANLLFHHFLSKEDLDWLAGFKDLCLTNEEMRALISAREAGAINNAAYRDINHGFDTLAASKSLRRLCDFQLIVKKGQGSGTYYLPTDKLLETWNLIAAQKNVVEPSGLENKPSGLESKPSGLENKPSGLESKPSGFTSDQYNVENYDILPPSELATEIARIGKKEKIEVLRQLILKLCSWNDLSLNELAQMLKRNDDYLRQQVIKPLMLNGQLCYTLPNEPSHPKQKYRATTNYLEQQVTSETQPS